MKVAESKELDMLKRKFGELEADKGLDLMNYECFLLDVFPKALSEEESILIIDKQYNIDNEWKFIKFFKWIYETRGPVFVKKQGENLDYAECVIRDIFGSEYDHIMRFLSIGDNTIRIDSHMELNEFLMLSTREICLFNYFCDDSVIVGNFDLTFPAYIRSLSIGDYKMSAGESMLHLRR